MIVGLTGGIASGKSVVSDAFADLGIPIVDTDLISRELVTPGSDALKEIVQTFGDVLHPNGSLNRPALRESVFGDETKRRQLEAILHPRIRSLAFARARNAETSHPYVVMVVPLLFESGYAAWLDRVLVVDATETQQKERLLARDSLSEDQATSIMAAQLDRESRLEGAHDILDASGSLMHTRTQVERLHRQYLSMARSTS